MSAGATADPGETAGEHTTADVSVEFALHELRHHLASTCDDSRESRAVMTNRAMQWDVLDVTWAIARRQRRAGLSGGPFPTVLEWDDEIPPFADIVTHLKRAHGVRGSR